MKIIISKIVLVATLICSLSSFANDKKAEAMAKVEAAKLAGFGASIFQLNNTHKVKLSVDKKKDSHLRIILKDQFGRTHYNELYSKNEGQYRRTFDFTNMADGTYQFELVYKDYKLTKEVQLETNQDRIFVIQ
ncbi:MAG TPA: hypothetical protein VGN64_17095 [Dyadobacter sp.]|jgi:hypothetical protein|nr:hypothetical protein [Dyadobacter sp.]